MRKLETYIEKLNRQIDEIIPIVDQMLDNSAIYYDDPNVGSSIFFVGVDVYHWSKKDERSQIKARDLFSKLSQNIELLLDKANPTTQKAFLKTNKNILNLIDQVHAPSSIDSGKRIIRGETKVYKDFLSLFIEPEIKACIVPDTNCIVQFPDPISYKNVCSSSKFEFIILPTILSELENQKNNHRNQVYKKKVKSVITRLKGYRNQGDVLKGIIVDKTITVKMIATEPDFAKTLKWLNPIVNDDKIIASTLELQIEYPSNQIILVTGDINLQNKAQMANLTVVDPDILT